MIKVLFVCLGNICRSPLAEGIFKSLVAERKWNAVIAIDSAGTGDWHCGNPPDARARAVAQKHGLTLDSICRQVSENDFVEFDLILAMDAANVRELTRICPPAQRTKIHLIRDYDAELHRGKDVPDPYYGEMNGFEDVFQILERCSQNLLNHLIKTRLTP